MQLGRGGGQHGASPGRPGVAFDVGHQRASLACQQAAGRHVQGMVDISIDDRGDAAAREVRSPRLVPSRRKAPPICTRDAVEQRSESLRDITALCQGEARPDCWTARLQGICRAEHMGTPAQLCGVHDATYAFADDGQRHPLVFHQRDVRGVQRQARGEVVRPADRVDEPARRVRARRHRAPRPPRRTVRFSRAGPLEWRPRPRPQSRSRCRDDLWHARRRRRCASALSRVPPGQQRWQSAFQMPLHTAPRLRQNKPRNCANDFRQRGMNGTSSGVPARIRHLPAFHVR
jgi:hypothetical protein